MKLYKNHVEMVPRDLLISITLLNEFHFIFNVVMQLQCKIVLTLKKHIEYAVRGLRIAVD